MINIGVTLVSFKPLRLGSRKPYFASALIPLLNSNDFGKNQWKILVNIWRIDQFPSNRSQSHNHGIQGSGWGTKVGPNPEQTLCARASELGWVRQATQWHFKTLIIHRHNKRPINIIDRNWFGSWQTFPPCTCLYFSSSCNILYAYVSFIYIFLYFYYYCSHFWNSLPRPRYWHRLRRPTIKVHEARISIMFIICIK